MVVKHEQVVELLFDQYSKMYKGIHNYDDMLLVVFILYLRIIQVH